MWALNTGPIKSGKLAWDLVRLTSSSLAPDVSEPSTSAQNQTPGYRSDLCGWGNSHLDVQFWIRWSGVGRIGRVALTPVQQFLRSAPGVGDIRAVVIRRLY